MARGPSALSAVACAPLLHYLSFAYVVLFLISLRPQASSASSNADGSDYSSEAAAGGSPFSSGAAPPGPDRKPPLLPPSGAWRGLNLGNLPIFPFRSARVEQSEKELRQLLRDAVNELADAGGNLLRVWLHIDGSTNPCWGQNPAEAEAGDPGSGSGSGSGPPETVVGCNAAAVEDLKWLLRRCAARGVRVLLTLWSHDVLGVRRDNPPSHRARALHMLRTASATNAYIDRCLTPLVRHLADTPLPHEDEDEEGFVAAVEATGPGDRDSFNRCAGSGRADDAEPASRHGESVGVRGHPISAAPADTQPHAGQQRQQQEASLPASYLFTDEAEPLEAVAVSSFPQRSVAPEAPPKGQTVASSTGSYHEPIGGSPRGASNGAGGGGAGGGGAATAIRGSVGSSASSGGGRSSTTGAAGGGDGATAGTRNENVRSGVRTPRVAVSSSPPEGGATSSQALVQVQVPAQAQAQVQVQAQAQAQVQRLKQGQQRGAGGGRRLLTAAPAAAATEAGSDSGPPPIPRTRSPQVVVRPAADAAPTFAVAAPAAAAAQPSPQHPGQQSGQEDARVIVQANEHFVGGPIGASHDRGDRGSAVDGIGGGGPARDECRDVPTYSSVLLAYEVLNEPEGLSWDLRLYHNYMYDIAWGPYQIDDPDWYGGQSERAGDHRSFQVLKSLGGQRRSSDGRSAAFEGWYFTGGNRQPQSSIAGASASGLETDFVGCLSDGSVLAAPRPSAFGNDSSLAMALRQRFPAAQDAASTLQQGCAGGGNGSQWYGNADLAAEWEAVAAAVAETPPAPGWGGGGGGNMWFNRLMYQDVIGHANSELPYLLPLVSSCSLRTADVSVPQIQRFVSRLAAAIHAADPRARVTVGMHSMPYCTDVRWLRGSIDGFERWPRNLYSDFALRRAFTRADGSLGQGWDPSGAGTLDFYAPHGYPAWMPSDATTRLMSPFFQPASSLHLDKPALIGEFWDKVSENEALTAQRWAELHSSGGYMGGLGWAMLQVAEAPLYDRGSGGGGGGGDGRQLSAPRRIVKHEKRDAYLSLLRQMGRR